MRTAVVNENKPGKYWSPAQFKRWDRCQKQFELMVLAKLDWPGNTTNFQLGRTIHKLLDFQSRQLPVNPLLTHCAQNVQDTWQQLLTDPTVHWPVIASEWGFQIPITDDQGLCHWLMGRIDRLAWYENKLWIIDWKTGTATPKQAKEDWQTGVYLYATWEARHQLRLPEPLINPNQIRFLYVEAKASQPIKKTEIIYNQPIHDAWHQRLLETINRIRKTETFLLPPTCPDRFCQYRAVCGIEA